MAAVSKSTTPGVRATAASSATPGGHATVELAGIPRLRRLYAKGVLSGVGKRGDRLPDRELVVGARVDGERLAAYDRVCGFRYGDDVPATYPHVLAFPLQVAQIAERAFPLRLAGLVHIRNSIGVYHPIRLGAELTLRVHAERLGPHPKGAQVDLVASAVADGRTLWHSRSMYLARGREVAPASVEHLTEPLRFMELRLPERTAAVWRLPRDLGRRYAKVSGDVNPIHMGRLRARLFGFRRPIAHGMWTQAHCLAALEGRLPDTYTVDVEFRKPVYLPSTVEFASAAHDDGWSFGVRSSGGGTHLVGRLTAT